MKKALVLLGLVLLGVGLGLWWLTKTRREMAGRFKEKPTPTPVTVREEKGGEKKLKVLMIVAPKNFRDEELFETKRVLEEKGAQVEVASKGVDEAWGMLGGKATIDKDLEQVELDDYEGVVFVGGVGASVYFDDQKALSLARQAFQKGKVVGAICIAPSILANAGLLEGKRATAFPSEEENLKAKGAEYTGEEVTVEERVVTARGPKQAVLFGQAIAKALGLP